MSTLPTPSADAAPPLQNPDHADGGLAWRNGFAALGPAFYTRLRPRPLPSPYWVGRSAAMARELGLSDAWMASDEALHRLTGNTLFSGGDALASVYSGHQFGHWAGQLGDGRAIWLGETRGGQEIQLKGAGPTPYSRMGDGRAVLRSSIREFLCSEAMHGLGIPTTRALAVTGSDAPVRREELETAAVVTRVAPSFIRFGHFEHFSHNRLHAELKTLADHVIDRHYPACRDSASYLANPYTNLLAAVSERTARLLAQWQAVGFCHGVMNTDNMSILGLTIDYGPFQFLDAFDPDHICNHSDTGGRYAYNQQPNIARWNLFCLGQALMPLIGDQDQALAALEVYKSSFPEAFHGQMRAKLGLAAGEHRPSGPSLDAERALIDATLQLLARHRVDHSLFWRGLSQHVAGGPADPVRDLFIDRAAFDMWLLSYSEHLSQINRGLAADLMLKTNPKYVFRNHLGELAIRRANLKDFSGVDDLLTVLSRPFDEHPGFESFAALPPDWAAGIEISCSS